MKYLKQLTKTFAVHALIFSLVQTSFVFQVNAASATQQQTNVQELTNVANQAVGLYSQYLGQKQQMIMQQISAQQNQKLLQTMSPACRKADGTSCYTVAGTMFPECPLPYSISSMPQNVCTSATPDPSAIATMISYETVAKSWVSYFDQMQNESANGSVPIGLKCLEDKRKALDSQLTEMVNNLTRLQDQLNKDKETFKANTKKTLEDLAEANDELNGESGKNNLKLKTKDFSTYFSQSCQSIIGAESIAKGPSVGLLGIMKEVSPLNKKAADYNSNKALIESDVRRDIAKLQKSIADGGLEDFLNSGATNGSMIAPVNIARQKQAVEFATAKARIAKELKTLNYDIPAMDKNFAVDFDGFLASSQEFFKKDYINNCVTGADKTGLAISTDQILASLKQKSTGSQGTARDKYKAALANILNSDSFIDDKMAQIRALETTYKDITVTYQSSNGQKVTETPYDLYMKTIQRCETRYQQNDQFANSGSTSTSSNVSQKKKVERGQALLKELKTLHDNYSSNLGNNILDQALSCGGETKKAGSSACSDGSAFDTKNEAFCMSTAGLCSNEIQGCFSEANKLVETKKTKMENLAKNYNTRVQELVARSNNLYTVQKNAVMDMIKVVQARFPGTNFQIPEGMFVSMPELKKDAFGVDLANDGNLSFMEEFPKKIDLLKKVFKDQQTLANNEIKDYIDKQNKAMTKNKDAWEKLADSCTKNIDISSQGIAKMNDANAKKQAEEDSNVAKFCSKYGELASHPMGACEDAEGLTEDVEKIAGRISQNAQAITRAFRRTCNSYNNESEEKTPPCKDVQADKMTANEKSACAAYDRKMAKASGQTDPVKKGPSIKKLCPSGSSTTEAEFIANAAANYSTEDQAKFKNITTLKDVISKVEITSGYGDDFFDRIQKVVADKGVCTALVGSTDNIPEGKNLATVTAELTAAQEVVEDLKDATTTTVTTPAKPAVKGVNGAPDTPAVEAVTTTVAVDANKRKRADAKVATLKDQQKALIVSSALNSLTPDAPTKDDQKYTALNSLGEQADTSCDTQAMNNMMPKDTSSSSLLQNFDNAILGRAR